MRQGAVGAVGGVGVAASSNPEASKPRSNGEVVAKCSADVSRNMGLSGGTIDLQRLLQTRSTALKIAT